MARLGFEECCTPESPSWSLGKGPVPPALPGAWAEGGEGEEKGKRSH